MPTYDSQIQLPFIALDKSITSPPPPPNPREQTATAADGTHPTGMHSCLFLFFVVVACFFGFFFE